MYPPNGYVYIYIYIIIYVHIVYCMNLEPGLLQLYSFNLSWSLPRHFLDLPMGRNVGTTVSLLSRQTFFRKSPSNPKVEQHLTFDVESGARQRHFKINTIQHPQFPMDFSSPDCSRCDVSLSSIAKYLARRYEPPTEGSGQLGGRTSPNWTYDQIWKLMSF